MKKPRALVPRMDIYRILSMTAWYTLEENLLPTPSNH